MKPIAFALILTSFTLAGTAQPPAEPKWKQTKPINDLPNPYRRDANWARLPAGMKWGAVIGAEPGPDGTIFVVHRCVDLGMISVPFMTHAPKGVPVNPPQIAVPFVGQGFVIFMLILWLLADAMDGATRAATAIAHVAPMYANFPVMRDTALLL